MKTWFVTGASRGFGLLIVERALAAGDAVVATARDPRELAARFEGNPRLLAVSLDVTDEEQARRAARLAVEKFGRVDVLVNNAGYGLLGAVEEASGPEIERQFATNVFGLLAVTRAVLPAMRRQRSGHVINLSSVGGYKSYPGWGIYCASKFAVEALSESLAAELEPVGVKVTVVEPGFFRTDFLDASSKAVTEKRIDDYAPTVGAMRSLMEDVNHAQPGDPKRLADALMTLVRSENPPLRLPLGSDTLKAMEEKDARVRADVSAWREVAISTDYPKAS